MNKVHRTAPFASLLCALALVGCEKPISQPIDVPDAAPPATDGAAMTPTDTAVATSDTAAASAPDTAPANQPDMAAGVQPDTGPAVTGPPPPNPIDFVEYAVPTAMAGVNDIVAGKDGNMYFTETEAGKIGRITPAGQITEFPLPPGPVAKPSPHGITVGPDGNIWFTELLSHRITRLNPDGTFSFTQLPVELKGPANITTGADGALWFTCVESNDIGRLAMDGTVRRFFLPTEPGVIVTPAYPRIWDIASTADGTIWFTRPATEQIGRLMSSGLSAYTKAGVSGRGPRALTVAPDGRVWFTMSSNQVGVLEMAAGSYQQKNWAVASPGDLFDGITPAEGGYVYFGNNARNKIGRINIGGPAGAMPAIDEYPNEAFGLSVTAPTNNLAIGPGRTLWFTQTKGNKIGRARY